MPNTRSIEVKLFATLRMRLGVASVTLTPEADFTVRDMIRMLEQSTGAEFYQDLVDPNGDVLRSGTIILLDGTNIHHMQGLDTPV
ncbi:MAG: MoaD/ThiS family protein, partial [Spirochaetaceae bacterium]